MPRCRLDELVYPQKRATFGASFIEISEIDAHSPLAILLLYKDWIGEPVRVKRLLDEDDRPRY